MQVMSDLWNYDNWASREPSDWSPGRRGDWPDDQMDFHVDLGCGRVPKGRIGVDRYPAGGVSVLADLDNGVKTYSKAVHPNTDAIPGPGYDPTFHPRSTGGSFSWGLPFETSSIKSMISHHTLEHVGQGFLWLMEECHRVLEPDAPFRIIVPWFPSYTAVADPDHKRYFTEGSFISFGGWPDVTHWMESFSVPYVGKNYFNTETLDLIDDSGEDSSLLMGDAREMRITLKASK